MENKIGLKDYLENPKQLLVETATENQVTGSSTFVITSLNKENYLKVSFIGDSCKI